MAESRSPLPENRVPSAVLIRGKAARLRSNRKVVPKVPAPSTTRRALTVVVGSWLVGTGVWSSPGWCVTYVTL